MYGLHFNKTALYSAIARKNGVRILSLNQHFFLHNKNKIDGLDIALYQVEAFIKQNGFPLCDYQIPKKGEVSL